MTKAGKRDDEHEEEEEEEDGSGSMETHPKRTTSFVARLTHKKPVHHDLATRIAMEHENSKYWARILLLFPLAPVCVALTTVVIGGVIINVATNDCNASLMMCFGWWGIYGTLQATTATSSGFESCLSMSPSLYIVSQYEVAVFWILFLVFIGFVVNERTAKLRQEKLDAWSNRKSMAKRESDAAEEAAQMDVLEAAQEKARLEEEELRKQNLKMQERLCNDSEGEEDEGGEGDDAFADEEEIGVDGGAEDGEEEEEVLLDQLQETSP